MPFFNPKKRHVKMGRLNPKKTTCEYVPFKPYNLAKPSIKVTMVSELEMFCFVIYLVLQWGKEWFALRLFIPKKRHVNMWRLNPKKTTCEYVPFKPYNLAKPSIKVTMVSELEMFCFVIYLVLQWGKEWFALPFFIPKNDM